MKKSEMIYEMHEVVANWRGECTIDQLVNHILNKQEELGMYITHDIVGEDGHTRTHGGWEPEDET